jgi:Tol biopolymer transport system component
MALLAAALVVPASASGEHSVPELITTGPGTGDITWSSPVSASPDGKRVLFSTYNPLVPEDVDQCEPEPEFIYPCEDIYQRLGGVTSLVSTGPTDTHGPWGAGMRGAFASKDRTRVFFGTGAALVAADTNGSGDIYERSAGTTTLISTGQATPEWSLLGISEDGSRVFFRTADRLSPEDTDNCADYYERAAGTNRLLTVGITTLPNPLSTCATLSWAGSSADGARVFIQTEARATSDDLDNVTDLYEVSGGQLTLVTPGPSDDLATSAGTRPMLSRDGTRLFLHTYQRLVPEDTDPYEDAYERFAGSTRLLVGPYAGDSSPPAVFYGMSEDGSRVFFSTAARLAPEDTDDGWDLYERFGGQVKLVGTSPFVSDGDGFWAGPSDEFTGWNGISADGTAVVFASYKRLLPEDTDDDGDLYLRKNGETRLVTTRPNEPDRSFGAWLGQVIVSPDGSRVFFVSTDPLVPEDTDDNKLDVFEWHDGTTTLVPDGIPTPDPVELEQWPGANVHDGSRVFIQTATRLTPNDTDDVFDLYAVDLANAPPSCDAVTADSNVLWPANRRLVRIALSGATDPDGDPVSLDIGDVTQDERVGGGPDAAPGRTSNEVRLRAERDLRGDGRVYRIAFEASDSSGASCTGTARVSVPRQKHRVAVDSAPPSYNSFSR